MALRLALYSDQSQPLTDPIDERLLALLPPRAMVGYVPSSPGPDRAWFTRIAAYYRRYGLDVRYFGLEDEFVPDQRDELLGCDAIHLTGGNTFRFLYWLRKRGRFEEIRQYALAGGVLIGVSAGAILMTPNIESSLLCGDALYEGLDDFKGLSLVDFAVVPHVGVDESSKDKVAEYARRFGGLVYGVPDGGGIIVDGSHVEPVGPVWSTYPL